MKSHKTELPLPTEEFATLKAAISAHTKSKFKAICAVKGIKMQDVLGEMINEYVDKNKRVMESNA
jgi:hypothetical protein